MDEPGAGRRPVLVCIGGLPATGKTTIARIVATRLRAAYVRVDSIEAALGAAEGEQSASIDWIDAPGYAVGRAVAADQLVVGLDVVVESVNALASRRDAWRDVALSSDADLLEVEVVCSDAAEHRRRAEHRAVDVPGLDPPTWGEIVDREHEPWTRDRLVVDTARLGAEEAASLIMRRTVDEGR